MLVVGPVDVVELEFKGLLEAREISENLILQANELIIKGGRLRKLQKPQAEELLVGISLQHARLIDESKIFRHGVENSSLPYLFSPSSTEPSRLYS